ncbi:hypothetical protein H6503_05105 [Candidatus Woesearchaeota archaeon]|nr:hypothetical protein [Candidatus Woesearchaeota archaeon]
MSEGVNYLGSALSKLKSIGMEIIEKVQGEDVQLGQMLQESVTIDQPKILAIAEVLSYVSTFTQLTMDNVSGMHYGTRYGDINKQFSAARGILQQLNEHRSEDSAGGKKVTLPEKLEEIVIQLGGTPQKRIIKAVDAFLDVSADAKKTYDKAYAISEAWEDFRLALQDAEVLTYQVMTKQKEVMDNAQQIAIQKMEQYEAIEAKTQKDDPQAMTVMVEARQDRDVAAIEFRKQQNIYRTLDKVAKSLSEGYSLGEAFIGDMRQTSTAIRDLWETGVISMHTNQFIYPLMAGNITQKLVLDELTQASYAMKEGVNEGMKALTEQVQVNEAAVKAAHSGIIEPEVYSGYIDALLKLEETTQPLIDECEKNKAAAIQQISDKREQYQKKLLEIRLDYVRDKPQEFN